MQTFELETERLELIPLHHEELILLHKSREEFEIAKGLTPSQMSFSGEYSDLRREAFQFWIENSQSDDSDFRWHTDWEIVLRAENKSIGGMGFLGAPDKAGDVILGFIIDKNYRNNGYMTEAVEAITNWALEQEGVRKVVSFYGKDDSSAISRMLEKSGFVKETIFVKTRKRD